MRRILVLLPIIWTVWGLTSAAAAQTGVTICPSSHTDTLPAGLEDAVAAALSADNPCPDCAGFAITDASGPRVSVAGLSTCNDWDVFTDLLWVGSVDTAPAAEGFTAQVHTVTPNPMFAPQTYDSFTYLPFPSGTWAIYGSEGVHGRGDWAALTGGNWAAVDFFGSNDYEQNGGYPNYLYASQTAEVTWVCRDANNVGFMAGDFLYLHLAPDAAISPGDVVYRGHPVYSLAQGSWTNLDCGYSQQQDNHWHIHVMTPIRDGVMRWEDWVVDVSTERFTNLSTGEHIDPTGDQAIRAYWAGDGGPPPTPPPAGTPGPGPDPLPTPPPTLRNDNVWSGIVNFLVAGAKNIHAWFPAHQRTNLVLNTLTLAGVGMRIVYIMLASNFNFFFVGTTVTVIALTEPIRILRAVYMLIKQVIPFV